MLGFADPMPATPPRLDRAEAGMEIWLIGPENPDDFAGTAYSRVVLDHVGGRPADVDHAAGPRVVEHAVRLAHAGIPVLHDVSIGGVAVAVAEICFASDVGARIDSDDWRTLLSAAPHRFLAVTPAGTDLRVADVPVRRIGTTGGSWIDFGRHGSVSVGLARSVWQNAIPQRMAAH